MARAASYYSAAQGYTMVVGVDRSSASAALKSVSFTRSHECSQCANRASPEFIVSCKFDASTLFQVTRATVSSPRRAFRADAPDRGAPR